MVTRQARRSLPLLLLAAATLAATIAAGHPPLAADDVKPIDINKAGVEELQQLPGVGAALAKRIVEFRESNGPFGSVDELLKVRGIGEKSLERFRHLVTVGKKKS